MINYWKIREHFFGLTEESLGYFQLIHWAGINKEELEELKKVSKTEVISFFPLPVEKSCFDRDIYKFISKANSIEANEMYKNSKGFFCVFPFCSKREGVILKKKSIKSFKEFYNLIKRAIESFYEEYYLGKNELTAVDGIWTRLVFVYRNDKDRKMETKGEDVYFNIKMLEKMSSK